jgi:hypothetical protein
MARVAPLSGPPATSGVVTFTLPDSSGAAGVPQTLLGGEFTETAGSTAGFRIYDGTGTSGTEIVPLTELAAHQTLQLDVPENGIEINSGSVYVQIVSGAIEGELYW